MHILVDAMLPSDLRWDKELTLAEGAEHIVWEIELGQFSLTDEMTFLSLQIALKHFVKTLWFPFKDKTERVIVYRSSLDFDTFSWDATQKAFFDESGQAERFYCVEAISDYLHRLTALLPEELELSVVFNRGRVASLVEALLLTSKERFSYLKVELEGVRFTENAERGLLLPSEDLLDDYELVEGFLEESMRIIPESLLSESWDGLNELIIFSDYVSPMGLRQLLGFVASGGKLLVVGPLLDLPIDAQDQLDRAALGC